MDARILLFGLQSALLLGAHQSYQQTTTTCTKPDGSYVLDIQISTSDSLANCSSCDQFLATAQEQLRITNVILDRLQGNTSASIDSRPADCADVQAAGFDVNGRYAIYPTDGGNPFFVSCDMETDGGGWTVFQRRQDGSVDFYLSWADYKYGFGNLNSEHWLGNDKIHRLTSQRSYELRVDLADFEGSHRYAEYDRFFVADETQNYRLTVGDYSGTAGDSLVRHNGMPFSTKDRDNDLVTTASCAAAYRGAWWYEECHDSNLNGLYLEGNHTSFANGVNWRHWLGSGQGYHYSLKRTEMKMRPRL